MDKICIVGSNPTISANMTNDEVEEELSELTVMCEKIFDLMEREAKQQMLGDYSHSALNELDAYIKTFEESDSLLMTTGALRYSSSAAIALKNWQPLLEVAVKKWPKAVEDGVFVGLIKS